MTIRELAEKAGVSPATVSIVLNGKKGVGAATRERILKMAEAYDYKPPRFNENQSTTVLFLKFRKHGLLVEENQGFVSSIMDAIEERCRSKQYTLSIVLVDHCREETLSAIDFSQYCGAIVLATEINREDFGLLDKIPIPYVAIDNSMKNFPCNAVGINNWENVYLALKCCADHGMKRIAHFKSSIQIENFIERQEAFDGACRELGLEFSKDQEYELYPTLLGAYENMNRLLKEGSRLPECAFADNDSIAIGAIKALKKHGYKVPEDISVIGFDDIPFSAVNSPSLSTVRVQRDAIGIMAVDLLFTVIANPAIYNMKMQVTGDLILRSSMKTEEK